MEEYTLGNHSQSNQTSVSTTNAVNTPSAEMSATSIHIEVEGGGADVRIPVHTTQWLDRTERGGGHQGAMGAPYGLPITLIDLP